MNNPRPPRKLSTSWRLAWLTLPYACLVLWIILLLAGYHGLWLFVPAIVGVITSASYLFFTRPNK